ncbi:hypothetical protein E2C01_093123 [Portunus trituberculatus]|uniref:Uncharacterized protein n=1 Tax=Portunus trituberculatus TaxID=210409 RepID=A0A5B7JI83_PORTR|nr:hypothetical protein [Portunus trituberculatus]
MKLHHHSQSATPTINTITSPHHHKTKHTPNFHPLYSNIELTTGF